MGCVVVVENGKNGKEGGCLGKGVAESVLRKNERENQTNECVAFAFCTIPRSVNSSSEVHSGVVDLTSVFDRTKRKCRSFS